MSHTATVTVTETVEVESMETSCDGGSPAQGHPRVYLHLDPDSHDIVCPYCSRKFVLKAGASAAGGH
ncbi:MULTISPECIES: zinc-finger domain-containing protein [unclassified Haematospirillum]|uniref:zinc-finger domain-containing protein n=1 Tax=unclassified Haematospirillum TaxID=2622088 RepID=UPI00143BDCC7|nr:MULTISPECIES: zinc-finger domain-containing protein [unclassified Haematospirillum]NKD55068.1 zinc-finger domain-containing protein [Haematospirillum sp. H4890]NKD75321.1 zinc-finger domain-containing protein [Haematospirillum sp. H4485]NKD87595.1 zinc-finger domain-containing protein [Haematospirillum sp. 15-248]